MLIMIKRECDVDVQPEKEHPHKPFVAYRIKFFLVKLRRNVSGRD